jgi:shikimate 5-dehydrogenase
MSSPALQDILALLGCPAAGNPAQYLFERAIEAADLDCRFVTCEVGPEDLASALAGVSVLGFRGCLLSGPLRWAVMPLVDSASPTALFAGGATLIERGPTGLLAHMTDGRGTLEAVRAHVDPAERRALVVGAGTTGRAVALELALAGIGGLVVADPRPARAHELVAALNDLTPAVQAATLDPQPLLVVPDDVQIVVLAPTDDTDALGEIADLRPDLVVADLNLTAHPSPIAQRAAHAGCCMIDGLEIHAARTAIDFRQLTGAEADPDVLREALDEFLAT